MLKLHFPSGQSIKYSYDSNSCCVKDLIQSIKSSDPNLHKPELLMGYPPQPIHYESDEDKLSKYIPSGSMITIREKLSNLIPQRHVILADNSCLFNAIIVGKQLPYNSNDLRDIIVNIIKNNPLKYNSILLGKDPDEYCQLIQNSSSWGGEIELSILSEYFGFEIAVIDIETGNVYTYQPPHEQHDRIYLLYDGIHYDLLIFAREGSSLEQKDSKTIFRVDDVETLNAFQALASDLKLQKSFVNLSTALFRCLVCNSTFNSQVEMIQHATLTGHQNFGQA